MNVFDIIILIPLCFGLIRGFIKGFVQQIASLAGVVIGIYCAKFYSDALAQLFFKWFDMSLRYGKPVAFCVFFAGIGLGFYFVARLINNFLKKMELSGLNRLAGALFGGLKFLLIISIFINVFQAIDEKVHFVKEERKDNSLLYYPTQKVVLYILPYINFSDFSIQKDTENEKEISAI